MANSSILNDESNRKQIKKKTKLIYKTKLNEMKNEFNIIYNNWV